MCPERLLGYFWCTHGRNGLQFGMRNYLDNLQNLLAFSHGLYIFLFLVQIWLIETDRIKVSGNFLDNAWKILFHVCNYLFLVPLFSFPLVPAIKSISDSIFCFSSFYILLSMHEFVVFTPPSIEYIPSDFHLEHISLIWVSSSLCQSHTIKHVMLIIYSTLNVPLLLLNQKSEEAQNASCQFH